MQSLHGSKPNPSFQSQRRRALFLISVYLPVLILPWVLTCITMFRPIMKPSYINQIGQYSVTDVRRMQYWYTAAKILDGIASVLAIPTVSSMLAYGAVIYTQRRQKLGQRELNIRQMLTVADKSWENIHVLWSALWNRRDKRASPYLWFGFLLVLLATIQPPLRQILIQDEPMALVTCNDHPIVINNDDPTCDRRGLDHKVIGHDPEPQYLVLCPQNMVIQRTRNKIIDVQAYDVQSHLWREVDEDINFPVEDQDMNTFLFYYGMGLVFNGSKRGNYFVSSVLNGTTTGVLREHAIRMDTDVQCTVDDDFPDNCAGDQPFVTSFTSPALNVSVCAEGSFDRCPWNNTRNKQEINERLWIKMQANPNNLNRPTVPVTLENAVNFTMRCDAKSRRGWFELGNYQNNFTHQPMLETWPTLEVMMNEFNDIDNTVESGYWPVEEERSDVFDPFDSGKALNPFGILNFPTPGPLMSAALALFGNGTLLHAAREASTESEQKQAALNICKYSQVPFYLFGFGLLPSLLCYNIIARESQLDLQTLLPDMLAGFVGMFDSPVPAQQLLEMTAFFANEALLMTTAEIEPDLSREIYTSPGYTILKPQLSVPGIAVISAVIGLQVLGILILLWFIYSAPSWTVSLDALTLARIGAQIHSQGKELDSANVSGVVGIGEYENVVQHQPGASNGTTQRKIRMLGLGETGVISKASLQLEFG